MLRAVTIEEQAENVNNPTFGDDRLGVMFYMRTEEDQEATKRDGIKRYRDREFIKILIPGDRNCPPDRPVQKTGIVSSDDTMRWPRQYERFKANMEQKAHDGMPLSLWPQMPNALAKELEFFNVFTVEQLATMPNGNLSKFQGGQGWQQKAAAFVAAVKDQSTVNQLNAALEDRDSQIKAQQEALDDQAKIIDKLSKRLDKLEK
jgi:hypothetical protein